MGTACSVRVRDSSIRLRTDNSPIKPDVRSKSKNVIRSNIDTTLLNSFSISQEEADYLLQEACEGTFVFSHNMESEMFLSMSTGKYVCHHPILKKLQFVKIGERVFDNVENAISFYRTIPLGDAILTEQKCFEV
ncbi:uncharacterized protein LOC124444091 isoform X2 [Xenia sp. Carnegie-2017]|uniref:uncharacterized protein LOC124444091 isoform X2 n=1 Tax=Xenia sp. Carnegie-2017 TaxID=2897299 RepID=UPI001F037273|nr:uncharacterized protein LOC124444091 isoform X2 [Xenia sp. Carnegie-2017]